MYHICILLINAEYELDIILLTNGNTMTSCCLFPELISGQIARSCYDSMKRDAASLRIQKDTRMYLSRKAYKMLCYSSVTIQTGIRGMAARNELRIRKQKWAAILIQVIVKVSVNGRRVNI